MLARVAERMYWTGRYLERVESTARLVNSYANLLLDLPSEITGGWYQLVRIVDAAGEFDTKYDQQSELDVQKFLLTDRDHGGSLLSSMVRARENIRTTRDIVPTEAWECVNEMYLFASKGLEAAKDEPAMRYETLSECVTRCQQISGLLAGTMSRGLPTTFLNMGYAIERADMASRVVDVAAVTLAGQQSSTREFENTLWMGVLKSLSAYQMYRQYVRRRVSPPDVVEFLLANSDFPRALRTNLDSIGDRVASLPRHKPASELLSKLRHQINQAKFKNMSGEEIDRYLLDLQKKLASLHGIIASTWFSHGIER